MKKLILLILFSFPALIYGQKDVKITKLDSVNVLKLQNIIAFKGEEKKVFDNLISEWYYAEIAKGVPPNKALLKTADKIAKKLESFGNNF